jgi:alpha-tubulin suppressor-like RCC1 family protein
VLVRSLGGAASWVSAGGKHTCAVVASEVRCWGSNSDGQLATDDDDSESSPAYADGVPRTATRVSAGQGHTCALVADGDVYCWGANSHGQIGVGPGFDDELRPSRVGLRRAALDVVAGGAHTCALLDDGTVLCWGDGRDGQLGHGGTSPRFSPAVVPGVLARSITVGARHTCALTATSAYCWGDNGARQLGNGSDMAESVLPSDVWGAAGITRISAGSRHTCSRRESGSISCWGTGDLGEGTTESNIPVTFTVP